MNVWFFTSHQHCKQHANQPETNEMDVDIEAYTLCPGFNLTHCDLTVNLMVRHSGEPTLGYGVSSHLHLYCNYFMTDSDSCHKIKGIYLSNAQNYIYTCSRILLQIAKFDFQKESVVLAYLIMSVSNTWFKRIS